MTGHWWVPGAVLALGVGAALAVAAFVRGLPANPGDAAFNLAGQDPEIVRAYEFVAAHQAHAATIPCYCGCYALDHRHLLDCFVTPRGSWEPHASGCAVCRDEAFDLQAGVLAGQDIAAIRASIDSEYGKYGKPTNTP